MLCPNCNTTIYDGDKFCPTCGTVINTLPEQSVYPPIIEESFPVESYKEITENDLPEQYRPLSPWSYFGLSILFTIPLVGFIFLIVFSFNGSNINRRNFARSYWCALIIVGTVFILGLILSLLIFRAVPMTPSYH